MFHFEHEPGLETVAASLCVRSLRFPVPLLLFLPLFLLHSPSFSGLLLFLRSSSFLPVVRLLTTHPTNSYFSSILFFSSHTVPSSSFFLLFQTELGLPSAARFPYPTDPFSLFCPFFFFSSQATVFAVVRKL